jgi:hypothetical protein
LEVLAVSKKYAWSNRAFLLKNQIKNIGLIGGGGFNVKAHGTSGF